MCVFLVPIYFYVALCVKVMD